MSASTVITLGYGSFGSVHFIPTLGYGNYAAQEAGVYPGAGRPVYWQGRRRKLRLEEQPERHLRAILDRVVAEYYGEIVEAELPQEVKKEAAKVVKPFAEKKARFKALPRVSDVDWKALERDADAVAAILRIWFEEIAAREIANDDEEIMLLMG